MKDLSILDPIIPDIINIGGGKLDQAIRTLKLGLEHNCIPDLTPKWKAKTSFKRDSKGVKKKLITQSLIKPKPLILRKISSFPDKEGKTRTIAIFDYFSQTALKPLHT
jgi:hypothetical protein